MFALIQRFAAICLLRAGPADLPASRALLGLVLFVYTLLNVALLSSLYGMALVQAVTGTLTLAAFTWILLWRRHAVRIPQTLTALAGVGFLLDLMFWPLLVGAMPGDARTLLTVGLLIWSLLAMGHVLGKALEWPLSAGFVLALCYDVISYYISVALFPVS